ncbi:MAG: hypothetical protein ABIT16_03000 [Croceibacterium sp.]
MSDESFSFECDRLSAMVDTALFERIRWERDEGPKLATLVQLVRQVLEPRPEFELLEEGATRDIKRFVLKIHGNRVMAVAMRIVEGRAVLTWEAIERSSYEVETGEPISADFAEVDQQWMIDSLERVFARVRT